MGSFTVLVSQTVDDVLARLVADDLRRRDDVELSHEEVLPCGELFACIERLPRHPDLIILVGFAPDIERLSEQLLGAYASLGVARIVIGSEFVHMDIRQIDLQQFIASARALLVNARSDAARRATEFRAIGDPLAPAGRLRLVESTQGTSMLMRAMSWLDAVLRLHIKRTAAPGADLPGLSVSRATIDSLLIDLSGEPDTEIAAAQLAEETAREELLHACADGAPQVDALADLCRGFGLTSLETRAFLLCLAPELDAKYQRIFGYINDDLSRRNASLTLIAAVLGNPIEVRAALARPWRLLRLGAISAPSKPLPHGDDPLRVAPALVAWAFGARAALMHEHSPDAALRDAPWPGAHWLAHDTDTERIGQVRAWFENDRERIGPPRRLVLAGSDPSLWRAVLEQVAGARRLRLLRIELRMLAVANDTSEMQDTSSTLDGRIARIVWAASLADAVSVIDEGDAETHDTRAVFARLCDALAEVAGPAVLIVHRVADIGGMLRLSATQVLEWGPVSAASRQAALQGAAGHAGIRLAGAEVAQLAAAFPLSIDEYEKAARVAAARGAREAPSSERAACVADACREVASPSLPRFATRLESGYGLSEVVLPEERHRQLTEIVAQVRHAPKVYSQWGFGAQLPYGKGVAALFSGPSGTGKTMAAGAIGAALRCPVFAVDLARVVSKFIGETEKHLDAVFAEAEKAHAVLLFDEADALFTRRAEVKDAHDRYANLETAFLLQRLEAFSGLAILTTNLAQNLDRAFLRRLRFIVEFPLPDATAREQIWRQCLCEPAPLHPDVQFGFLARRIELSGGSIRQITLRAAFAAAAEPAEKIAMRHLVGATRAELLKLGMPGLEREFAEHLRRADAARAVRQRAPETQPGLTEASES
ncbi:ATP-binding protein [Caballeronia ptereochthonis]|uniref:ATP-binding protein n=1 Tax=Caballeronia ptereochthonis TaxID=1777144 RepID=UPI001357972E|nr:ATP-binding protein [Caballeronia ptereochthonis]